MPGRQHCGGKGERPSREMVGRRLAVCSRQQGAALLALPSPAGQAAPPHLGFLVAALAQAGGLGPQPLPALPLPRHEATPPTLALLPPPRRKPLVLGKK